MVQDVDGIIIAGSGYVDPANEARAKDVLRAYQQRGGRVAVIGRHHLGVDAVLPDNVAIGALAADHLVELGHHNVLVASGSEQLTTIADRLSGICSVFQEAGVQPTVLARRIHASLAVPASLAGSVISPHAPAPYSRSAI